MGNIRVASPCRADWKRMAGDDRVRHCGDCRRNVYNLSDMARDEAEALIVAKEGRLCVRYFQRADGTILLKDDCGPGVERRELRRRRTAYAAAISMFAALAGVIGWRLSRPAEPGFDPDRRGAERRGPTMGKYEGVWSPPKRRNECCSTSGASSRLSVARRPRPA